MSKKRIIEGWGILKIKDIFDRVRNPVKVIADEEYKQIGIRSHGKGIFYKEAVTGEQLGNKSVFWVEPDCFIVNIVFAWEMAVARTTNKDKGYIASHRFPMYRPKEEVLDLDFITYLFKSARGKYLLNLASPGGAGRNKTLGQKEFEETEVFIPLNIKEQQKIASILSTWDKAIELKEQLIERKTGQKKGLMQNLLNGRITKFGMKIEEYQAYKLNEIMKIKHGKDQKKVQKENGRYPILGTGGIIGRTDDFLYDKESVLIGRKGTIDRPYYMDKPFWTVDTLFYSEINEGFLPKYIYYLFNLIPWKYYNEATGVPSLSASNIGSIKVKLPGLESQKKISEILTKIDEEIELLKKESEYLKLQRQSVMQQLLTGKIRVKV